MVGWWFPFWGPAYFQGRAVSFMEGILNNRFTNSCATTLVGTNVFRWYMGISKNRGSPKWMVFFMINPIKIHDLGGLYTPILEATPPKMVLGVPISRPRTFRLSASVMWLADLGKVSRDVPESMRAPPVVFLIHHDPTKKCCWDGKTGKLVKKEKVEKSFIYSKSHHVYTYSINMLHNTRHDLCFWKNCQKSMMGHQIKDMPEKKKHKSSVSDRKADKEMRYQSHPGPPDGGAPALKSHVAETIISLQNELKMKHVQMLVFGIKNWILLSMYWEFLQYTRIKIYTQVFFSEPQIWCYATKQLKRRARIQGKLGSQDLHHLSLLFPFTKTEGVILRKFQQTPGTYPRYPKSPRMKDYLHKQVHKGPGYVAGVCWNFLRVIQNSATPNDHRLDSYSQVVINYMINYDKLSISLVVFTPQWSSGVQLIWTTPHIFML